MKTRILLFDIDGTLLNADGAGRAALNRAFATRHGNDEYISKINLQGMTDRAIMGQALEAAGLKAEPTEIDQTLALYVVYLREELEARRSAKAHPGVKALLSELVTLEPRLWVGLGTGNVEPGAQAKLQAVGLEGYFRFGGYGSDAVVRSEVLKMGVVRGARVAGVSPDNCDVYVIGDTCRDIDAALAIGATAVGVGTGGVSPEVLLQRGAAHAFTTLEDHGAIQVLSG
jgi:phosphoglycolate phosphatase